MSTENIAENISKLPEHQEKLDKIVDQYKTLPPETQSIVDRKLKAHFEQTYFKEKELKQNNLSLRMSSIFKNLSEENQKTLQAGNNSIGEIAKDVLLLIKGIIDLVENVSKVINNPKKAVYEWFKGEILEKLNPPQRHYQQNLSKPNQKAASTLSR